MLDSKPWAVDVFRGCGAGFASFFLDMVRSCFFVGECTEGLFFAEDVSVIRFWKLKNFEVPMMYNFIFGHSNDNRLFEWVLF